MSSPIWERGIEAEMHALETILEDMERRMVKLEALVEAARKQKSWAEAVGFIDVD